TLCGPFTVLNDEHLVFWSNTLLLSGQSGSAIINIEGLTGLTGFIGATGAIGMTGATGLGDTGVTGATGRRGSKFYCVEYLYVGHCRSTMSGLPPGEYVGQLVL